MDITLADIAKAVKLETGFVRDILTEKPGLHVPKNTLDLVFKAARNMNYDFKKLKIGKRMNQRKEVIDQIATDIKANPKWKRKEILAYLRKTSDLVERVHKRAFEQEFGK
jgi:DNA-binding LacI/PurR family transcriptional regulator